MEISWLNWSDAAFKKAKKEDKPILLDLTACWCHWCHVMDETSYKDAEVIKIIHEKFVPIRVDIDKHPVIRDRYNFGGFPTTAFLTPAGDIMGGGTYISPPVLRQYLLDIHQVFRKNKKELLSKMKELKIMASSQKEAPKGKLSHEIVEKALEMVKSNFDSYNGGFGSAPKFPMSEVLDFLSLEYSISKEKGLLEMITKSLNGMKPLHDKIEGGFFRYSVSPDWSEPHYEKMLETNAGLLRNYLNGFLVSKDKSYKEMAKSVLGYVKQHLADPAGGFYGSQDANETYYRVLTSQRKKLPKPYIDKALYVSWNGGMVSSFLLASRVLKTKSYESYALKTLDRLWKLCWNEKKGLFHFWDGNPASEGVFADHVHLGLAFLDAFEQVQDHSFLDKAEKLAIVMQKYFLDKKTRSFNDSVPLKGAKGLLKIPAKNVVENALAAGFFWRLSFLADKPKYRSLAKQVLEAFVSSYEHNSLFVASYAAAVEQFLSGPIQVYIIGSLKDEKVQGLLSAALARFGERNIVQVLDPRDKRWLPKHKFPKNKVTAYVCEGELCKGPFFRL
ncbi:MAG: DUF255 domain-containing protein [Nanoarchaeota archaeon]